MVGEGGGLWWRNAPVNHMKAAEGGEVGVLVGNLFCADGALRLREHAQTRPGGTAVSHHGEEVRRATDPLKIVGEPFVRMGLGAVRNGELEDALEAREDRTADAVLFVAPSERLSEQAHVRLGNRLQQ